MGSRNQRVLVGLPMAALMGLLLAGCAPPSSQTLRPGTAKVLLGADNDTSTPFTLVSIPALAGHRPDGRGLRVTEVLDRELAFTRYAVRYRSDRLTVTGVLVVPSRPGRHPLVVIAHGYLDPDRYTTGSMLLREQAALAQSGFVAFQIDYRNYAGSTREGTAPLRHPLGYPEDLVNAVAAVKRARLPHVDTSRIGLFGRSMGGGVVLDALVAHPHLARAAVLYSPVSSRASDNFSRWVSDDPTLRRRVTSAFGTPESRPAFWRQASSRTYLGRIRVPIQIDHGTADRMCPVRWSEATARALRRTASRSGSTSTPASDTVSDALGRCSCTGPWRSCTPGSDDRAPGATTHRGSGRRRRSGGAGAVGVHRVGRSGRPWPAGDAVCEPVSESVREPGGRRVGRPVGRRVSNAHAGPHSVPDAETPRPACGPGVAAGAVRPGLQRR